LELADQIDDPEDPNETIERKYWKSAEYQNQPRHVKLDQLWNSLVPDESASVTPKDFMWKEFPQIFT